MEQHTHGCFLHLSQPIWQAVTITSSTWPVKKNKNQDLQLVTWHNDIS